MLDTDRCPCSSGETYGGCCGRFHRSLASGGPGAPTAEALMRSRYSAFALGDAEYLRATWAAETRPEDLGLDDGTRWRGLEVVRTQAGGPFDTEGVVEFIARFRLADGVPGELRETSRFAREGERWVYVDGRASVR